MATYVDQRDVAVAAARDIAEKAKSENRELTLEEANEINAKGAEIQELTEKIKAARDARNLLDSLGTPAEVERVEPSVKRSAATLGEHALPYLKDGLDRIATQRADTRVSAPEWAGGSKAAGDTHTVDSTGAANFLTPYIDTNIIPADSRRPVVADWLGAGTINETSIKYFRENAAVTGGFGFVGENAKKPSVGDFAYDEVTESLKKIAGWIKISDEMAEDTSFLVSEINNRLLYQLLIFEEDALLNGTGTGSSIRGILQTSGVLVETAKNQADNLDAIYRATTQIQTNTGLTADGIVIHPSDYQALRLSKDGNGQYLAGGPFTGQYGTGSVLAEPALWGLPPIITPAIPQGTVLVGAGKQAATVYRKGGIRVDASNVDGEDFTHNRFTVLAEVRELLAVRQPGAFVKVTLGGNA